MTMFAEAALELGQEPARPPPRWFVRLEHSLPTPLFVTCAATVVTAFHSCNSSVLVVHDGVCSLPRSCCQCTCYCLQSCHLQSRSLSLKKKTARLPTALFTCGPLDIPCIRRFCVTSWTRGKGKTDKPTGKTISPKRSPSHLHNTTISPPPPSSLPGPFLPCRKPRLPPAVPLQVYPVACCPSRHGAEAQSWTTKQGLKTHVEMHSTGLLQGHVTDWDKGC